MKKYFNWLFLFFVITCHTKVFGKDDFAILSNTIQKTCSKEVEKKYKLLCMSTGGSTAYDIRQISISYLYPDEVTIPQARRIYVDIAEVFIKKYNNSKALRPYLRDYPFNLRHLALSLVFRNAKYSTPRKGVVAFMCGGSKNITYFSQVSDDPNFYDPQEVFSETYLEALRIVTEEKQQATLVKKS